MNSRLAHAEPSTKQQFQLKLSFVIGVATYLWPARVQLASAAVAGGRVISALVVSLPTGRHEPCARSRSVSTESSASWARMLINGSEMSRETARNENEIEKFANFNRNQIFSQMRVCVASLTFRQRFEEFKFSYREA